MTLFALVEAADAVAATSRRLEKIARLAHALQAAGPEHAETVVAFLSGTPRQGAINVGHAAVSAAADVAPASEATLTISDVDAVFEKLVAVQGHGATRERATALRELFARATRPEQDFLRRLLYGELRHGALEGVLTDAVARASQIPAGTIRRAAMMAGSLAAVARAALEGGDAAVRGFDVQLMRPIQPMLAQSAASVDEALNDIGAASLEYKLDGARVQIHKSGADVRIYSRTLHDVTDSAPEIVSLVKGLPANGLILDGEVIALRPDGRPYPFQTTMRRFGRRRDVAGRQAILPLTPFLFDLLQVDGTSLLDEPQRHRFAALQDLAGSLVVPRVERPTIDEARTFLERATTAGHEGVMVKALDAAYAAGRRGAAWLKVKPARTLDLVVLAAEWGHGRRTGWLSNLHLGARDAATGAFVMLGKTFKGLTDEMLAWQTERFLSIATGRDRYIVYVRPEVVVEVAFNEIQTSAIYPGGLTLRFARVKRYRPDKTAAEADTIATVRQLAGVGEFT